MEIDAVVQLVSTLGFPIVCCGALFWYINKTMKEFSDEMKSAMDKLSDSISKDTDATTKLVTTVELLAGIASDHKDV